MATGTESGSIREEYCPSHMQVEWEVSYETLQVGGNTVRSPTFKMEQQSYKLESEREGTDGVELHLLVMGRRIRRSPFTGRYWAGLKRTDGTYDLASHSEHPVMFTFDTECFEIMAYLGFIRTTDLDGLYLTSDGRLTFFFRMNTKRSPAGVETCSHGTPQMPKPESGSIRQEECSRHNHVEWNVCYETGQDDAMKLTSPAFSIDTQMYFFEMSTSDGLVSLHLFRLGCSVHDSDGVGRYWIGLKCRDGTYHLTNFSGKLDLSQDFGLWTRVGSQDFTASDLQERGMTLDRPLTFFFRMNAKTTGEELCIHDAEQVTPPASGSIRKEQCSSHRQVEWDVGCEVPHDREICLYSPVFKIGTQQYFFKLQILGNGKVPLRFFRLGRSVQGPASAFRCWIGIKRCDGTCYWKYFDEQLRLREEFGFWTKTLYDFTFKFVKERLDSRLTFFFRMNTEQTVPAMCIHDPAEVPALVSGSLRQDECSSHKHVEWDINYEALQGKSELKSPVFTIGTQMYVLKSYYDDQRWVAFSLHRFGHSIQLPPASVRYWAGLKSCNGTYDLEENCNETLDLSEDFGLWTMVRSFCFECSIIEEKYLKCDQSVTFFLRMNIEPTGSEICNHGPAETYAPEGEGFIEMQACTHHKHVTWTMVYEESRRGDWFSTSPLFKVGCQWYQLNLWCDSEGGVELELFRYGSAVRGPASSVLCWAGLKRDDGYYHHHIQEAEFDLREECSLPTSAASFILPSRPDLEKAHVTREKRLSFFVQINSPQSRADQLACAHGATEMCPPGEGSVREKEGRYVEWEVNYEARREYTHFSTSPVFKIGNQLYLLELCYETDGMLTLSLYRSGCAVEGPAGSVRCWAGIKRDYGMYHHKIEGVRCDLRRNCELWTRMTILGHFRRQDLEKQSSKREGKLTVFFLFSAEVRGSHGVKDVAVQADGTDKVTHKDNISKPSQGTVDVAVQADGNCKRGRKDRLYGGSEDLEKLREHFQL